jgi:ABC-type phosphate/phosphonate transport system substrate-binding protein
MKNSKHLLVIGGLLTVAALTACNQAAAGSKASDGGASSTGTTQNIHIQLVPSNDPTTLLTRATALAPMLAKARLHSWLHLYH